MTEINPSPKTKKRMYFLSTIRANWRNSTKEGEVLGYREIFSYSFAGSGVNGIGWMMSLTGLFSSTILIGSIYQISAAVLYMMTSVITFIGFVKAPIISMIMDNTRSSKGKFKPFLIWLGIPSVIFICLIPYVPLSWIEIIEFTIFDKPVSRAAFVIFILQVLISFTFPVTTVAYAGLGSSSLFSGF
ncbi:MAG: hypothetical protein EU530_00300 [Promethearchaeota archaeon]|nr:MAG: hypothetical protein EU530_00300 [Candidatus Lokiarchaeota archaeon]